MKVGEKIHCTVTGPTRFQISNWREIRRDKGIAIFWGSRTSISNVAYLFGFSININFPFIRFANGFINVDEFKEEVKNNGKK